MLHTGFQGLSQDSRSGVLNTKVHVAAVMVGEGRDILDAVVSDTISEGLCLVPVGGQQFELDLFAFLLQGVLSMAVLVLCRHRGQVTWLHQKVILYTISCFSVT